MSDFQEGEHRLTTAAQLALEELVDAYRTRLIEQVMNEYRSGPVSALDLVRLAYSDMDGGSARKTASFTNQIVNMKKSERRYFVRYMLGALLAALGVALVSLSIGNFFVSRPLFSAEAAATLVGAGFGAVVGGLVLAIISLRGVRTIRRGARRVRTGEAWTQAPENHDAPLAPSDWEFMTRWQRLEGQMSELAVKALPSEPLSSSFATILKRLQYNGVIGVNLADDIKRLLSIRNDLAHGGLRKGYDLTSDLMNLDALNEYFERMLVPIESSKRRHP